MLLHRGRCLLKQRLPMLLHRGRCLLKQRLGTAPGRQAPHGSGRVLRLVARRRRSPQEEGLQLPTLPLPLPLRRQREHWPCVLLPAGKPATFAAPPARRRPRIFRLQAASVHSLEATLLHVVRS
jgi:hypothetical protein